MLKISNTEGISFATASNAYQVYYTTSDSDVFDSVIDGLILEKYADEDVKEYIKHLPSNKKRIALASLIGDDHLLWSKINEIIKEEKSGYQRLKAVYTLLKEYVKILDVERKKHGEILTPFEELAEPMVRLVEKYDPEFWKNKNHKVLDSSAGYGTFLILATYKFMVGLKDDFEDEEERFKWIVENCLYYGELQARSVFSWLVAIDPHKEYKTNIYWGSFLTKDFDEHMKNVWGVEKFDLIIQNPPYQTRKEGNKKTQPLWHLFVQKSLNLLSDNAYMVMVHPGSWKNSDGMFKETQKIMLSNHMIYLNINSYEIGNIIFGVSTDFDYYLIKNDKNIKADTKILCANNVEYNFNLNNLEFIPSTNIDRVLRLVLNENKTKMISDSSYHTQRNFMSPKKTSEHIYPIIYTVKSSGDPVFWYSSKNDRGHLGIPKVVFSNGAGSGTFIDDKGEYGLSQFAYGIVDDVDNLKNIKKCLDNREFINLLGYGSASKYNKRIISCLNKDFWKEFI